MLVLIAIYFWGRWSELYVKNVWLNWVATECNYKAQRFGWLARTTIYFSHFSSFASYWPKKWKFCTRRLVTWRKNVVSPFDNANVLIDDDDDRTWIDQEQPSIFEHNMDFNHFMIWFLQLFFEKFPCFFALRVLSRNAFVSPHWLWNLVATWKYYIRFLRIKLNVRARACHNTHRSQIPFTESDTIALVRPLIWSFILWIYTKHIHIIFYITHKIHWMMWCGGMKKIRNNQ